MAEATSEGDRLTACNGRDAFASSAQARELARRVSRNGHRQANAYRCFVCGRWHVGTTLVRKNPRLDRHGGVFG